MCLCSFWLCYLLFCILFLIQFWFCVRFRLNFFGCALSTRLTNDNFNYIRCVYMFFLLISNLCCLFDLWIFVLHGSRCTQIPVLLLRRTPHQASHSFNQTNIIHSNSSIIFLLSSLVTAWIFLPMFEWLFRLCCDAYGWRGVFGFTQNETNEQNEMQKKLFPKYSNVIRWLAILS